MKSLKGKNNEKRRKTMHLLLVIGIVLLVLWVLGLISSYTLGGGIHALAVIAVILVVLWFFYGRV
jgi:hypothetical protein